MRIHINHASSYVYDPPATSAIQILRLTPRSFGGQTVRKWRIDLSHDGVLRQRVDAFGNIVHTLSLNGPISEVTVTAEGEVDTQDTHGVISDSLEPLPTGLFSLEI